jgi:beta-N-acetylhexosaminidase
MASATLLPGFVGKTLPEWLAARLRDGLAGVCIFGGNVVSREQLRSLTDEIRAANPNALIAIDEEGGDVTRLYHQSGSPYPGNAILGRIDDLAYTESVARAVGWELRSVGVNLDFAPDVDINTNPNNPVIGVRSFGTDSALVARHSAAWVRGLQSTGTAASAKHFPGHGDTAADSHLALPVVDLPLAELRARELLPFSAAIASRTVMTSHILLPQMDASGPATFSRAILQGLLREELGFEGVIVSDALDMKGASGEIGIPAAAVRALAAGCDLLCIGTDNTDEQLDEIEREIGDAVHGGLLDAARLAEAAARTRALAQDLLAEAARVPESGLPSDESAFPLERTIAAFDIRPGVVVHSDRVLVSMVTEANIAFGASPWGVEAAGANTLWVYEGEAIRVPFGAQPVVIGKDNHRLPWMREAIDQARHEYPNAVVIDMGWPSDDRAYADVATFGGSQHVGSALLSWLESAAAMNESAPRPELQAVEPLLVGLDIGGTKVHAVAIDAAGAIAHELRLPTGFGADAVLGTAIAAVSGLAGLAGIEPGDFLSIGVGIPGSVDTDAGLVAHAVNLGLEGLDLGPKLAARFGVPVRVENDVNAAALGAWSLLNLSVALSVSAMSAGTGGAPRSMAYLNLGTGMAAGVVLDGELWRGSRGTAGEVGHIPVDPNGALCSCGQRGCLETLASGSAVARQWPSEHPYPVVDLFESADRGVPLAIEVRDRLIENTAAAVRILILSVDVDQVVIGGGVSSLGDPLLDRIRGVLDSWAQTSPFIASLELSSRVDLVPPASPVAAIGAALAGKSTDRAPRVAK